MNKVEVHAAVKLVLREQSKATQQFINDYVRNVSGPELTRLRTICKTLGHELEFHETGPTGQRFDRCKNCTAVLPCEESEDSKRPA